MSQKSAINNTVPADNVAVDKSDIRANFSAAKNEINELFRLTSLPYRIAVNGFDNP